MKPRRAFVVGLVGSVVIVALSGCGRYAPAFVPPLFGTHTTDYVGTWVHTQHDSSYGATLILNKDGSATIQQMPVAVFDPFADGQSVAKATNLFSTGGTWSRIKATNFGSPEIGLVLDYVPSLKESWSAELIYDAGPGTRSLNFVIGDPDDGEFYNFSR